MGYFRESLFSEGLIIARNFAFQNGWGLTIIIGRTFASEIWGAYFREGLFYLFICLFIYFFFFWGGGLLS